MDKLPKYLRYLGLITAVIAVMLAIGSAGSSANESSRLNPESAIALAIAAFVFIRASELRPPS
ncbi:MAG: hypothetical protein WKG01_05955 [Kofleriaceae bacterium]